MNDQHSSTRNRDDDNYAYHCRYHSIVSDYYQELEVVDRDLEEVVVVVVEEEEVLGVELKVYRLGKQKRRFN